MITCIGAVLKHGMSRLPVECSNYSPQLAMFYGMVNLIMYLVVSLTCYLLKVESNAAHKEG